MKWQKFSAALLTAVAALGFACCAGASETIRAYYVQEGLNGKKDKSLKSDVKRVSPIGKSLTIGGSAKFTAKPPKGYKVSRWLWKAGPTSTTSGMDKIAGGSSTCTIDYSSEGQHTLCVSFVRKKITVTLDMQKGSGGSSSVKATYGADMPSITKPTRTGYKFGGYYTKTKGGGTRYYKSNGSSARKWKIASATTLYAKWTAKTYTVTLDKQSGSGGSSSVKATYASAMPSITPPTRTGYKFGGYYTEANGGGTRYYKSNGSSARKSKIASATTLYAKWTANTYTVTLDRQGGTGGSSSVSAAYGAAMPTAAMPTRTGYAFGGYYTEANGGGTQYYTANGSSARTWNVTSATTLYAKWTANAYTVTLDRQGGSGGAESVNATWGAAMPQITVPTRTGYAFGGYYSGTGGAGTKYYNADGTSARTSNLGSTTIYAKWTVNAYTVTLDSQGGTGGSPSTTATYGAAMPSADMPTRTGYAFGGYFTEVNGGGTQYYKADGSSARTWNIASATNLYAKWTANTYQVTLNRQSGSGGSSSVTATYGAAMPSADVPTRTGYTFGGYYTEVNGGGTQYYDEDCASASKWDLAGDATLYAKWTAKTYTVALNRRDGSGGPSSVTATYDAAMPTITPPTRTGYAFGGYFTSTGGDGTQYYKADGTSALSWKSDSDTTTLYAHWTANAYQVTFDSQGGTGGSPSATATYGAAMPAATMPTRTGYAFGGYFTEANGGGTQYYTANGSSVCTWNIASATNLYAKWTANTYAVTLDSQGGTGGSSPVTATYGAAMPSATMPTRTGYAFGGYFTEVNGGGTQYYKADGSSARTWNIADVTKLYAKWTASAYTVTLDSQGGSGGSSSAPATYGADMPSVTPPTRTGYTFGGYYTAQGGIGTKYYDADGSSARTWNIASATTLYAKWTAKTYSVTLDSQGGIGGPSSVTATYDAAMPTNNVTMPTRTGYTFGGYFTEVNGGGTQYYKADGTSARNCDLTAATTLYAKWTANTYTIAFDCGSDDAAGSMDTVPVEYGAEIALPSNAFTYAGRRFLQWKSGTNTFADGATVSNLTTVVGETVTLTAAWDMVVYTFEFAANGGSGTGPASANMTYDETLAMPAQTYDDREHYNFFGWSLDKDAEAADYEAGTNIAASIIVERAESLGALTGDTVTLYAVWQFQPSPYSAALDCSNLYFETNNTYRWDFDTDNHHKGESSMCQTGTGGKLTAVITNTSDSARSGKLSFWWAGDVYVDFGEEYARLSFSYDTQTTNCVATKDMVTNGTVQIVKKWANVVQAIEIPPGGSVEITFKNVSQSDELTVWLDDVSWTWDGEGDVPGQKGVRETTGISFARSVLSRKFTNADERFSYNEGGDVPGPEDVREITGISFAGGVMSLTFTNADERFSYNLRGTNEPGRPLSDWPVLWTTNGTGDITITLPADPANTKFFYRLETTSK